MALINCVEYNKQVSDQAFSCPNCGYPINSIQLTKQDKLISSSKMLKVSDIQKLLGISQGKVYALIRSKGFPKIIIGHRYFIPEDKYIKWIDENLKHTITL